MKLPIYPLYERLEDKLVQRAFDSFQGAVCNMCVLLGGGSAFVPKEYLNLSKISSLFQ